jgi:hypothetical protein
VRNVAISRDVPRSEVPAFRSVKGDGVRIREFGICGAMTVLSLADKAGVNEGLWRMCGVIAGMEMKQSRHQLVQFDPGVSSCDATKVSLPCLLD